jgi:hypothetical protein
MVDPYKKINKMSQGLPSHILPQFIKEVENEYPDDTFALADTILGIGIV